MRANGLMLVLLLAVPPAAAQTPSPDSAAIVALEYELTDLLAAGRFDEYATHLADDYARTTYRGTLERREEALANWRTRGAGGAARPRDLWVRVYGDAAVLTAELAGADPAGPRTRITKTFVRRQGRWLLAALHGCRVAGP